MDIDRILDRDALFSRRLVERANGRFAHSSAWILARTGDSVFWLGVIIILFWQKQPLAWDLLLAVVITAVLVGILKGIFRRQRPKAKWAIATDKYSFPSGHAARAAAVATTLIFAYPHLSPIWLVWALCVALARVTLARHYLSDVGSGLVIGLLTGLGNQLLTWYVKL